MRSASCFVLFALFATALGQRGSYAGTSPIGYPLLLTTTTTANPLGNRFGEASTTTQRLPVEALGDLELVNRIAKLPIDKQPFWYINWKALEEHRKNYQTYEQRPNPFISDLSFPQNPIPNQVQGNRQTANQNNQFVQNNVNNPARF